MKKLWTRAQVLAVLSVFAMSFSGCKGGKPLSGQAKAENGSSQKAPLADEPNATFKDLQGHDVTLASLKGKVVLVNFWATWCDPCRIEIPWMMEFQRKYASRGFTMLGVAMDDEGKSVVEPFVETTQFDVSGQPTTMNYPIVLGNDDIASEFGGLFGLPTSILITRDGKIQKKYIGLVSEDTLEQQIKALL
jgi:thiol-disulfide isomerase/thioredoxin